VHASELSGKGVNELKEVKRLSAGFYFFSADRIYE
jgi:hypothetical protein